MAEADREAVERVRFMEAAMDALQSAWNHAGTAALEDPEMENHLRQLTEYMDSGQWLQDYELDEAGGFPPDLKRGVLSQDGLYNLLAEIWSAETTEE